MKNNIRPQARPVRDNCNFRHFTRNLRQARRVASKKHRRGFKALGGETHQQTKLGADDADASVGASGGPVKDAKGVLKDAFVLVVPATPLERQVEAGDNHVGNLTA